QPRSPIPLAGGGHRSRPGLIPLAGDCGIYRSFSLAALRHLMYSPLRIVRSI
ncbi:unnamed protein product, partial [Urochloa humidicola]